MGHVHVHAPHELSEGHEEHGGVSGGERLLELLAVLLLSLVTLLTAWSGYQAARWSGEQSQLYAKASATRIRAQQQSTLAGQLRIDDLLYFNGWLDAKQSGNAKLAAVYRRRFRPEFVPAFNAWRGQHTIAGPLYVPQYKLAADHEARVLDGEADDRFAEGTDAKSNDDHYILSTVFFAAVLFFAGISLRLDWRPLRIVVLGFAAAMLLGGGAFVASLPVA
jgi:hypothetical protein